MLDQDRLIGRAAITQVLGRPAYEDARPLARFTYDLITNPNNPTYNNTGTLNVGNPDLGPYEAVNFDLSLEFYLQGRGLFSIAAGIMLIFLIFVMLAADIVPDHQIYVVASADPYVLGVLSSRAHCAVT